MGGKHDVFAKGDPSWLPPSSRLGCLCSALGRGRVLRFQGQLCHPEVLRPSPCPLGLSFPNHTTGGGAQKMSKTVLGSVDGLEAVRLGVGWGGDPIRGVDSWGSWVYNPPPPGFVAQTQNNKRVPHPKALCLQRPRPTADSEANSLHRPGKQRPAERDHSLIPRVA